MLNDSVIGSRLIEKQSSGIVEAENNFAPQKAISNDGRAYHICPSSARKKKLTLCRTYIKEDLKAGFAGVFLEDQREGLYSTGTSW